VKRLKDAKQRLAPVLAADQRATLTRLMATDVMRAALSENGLAGVAVVTADEEIFALAEREGATVLKDEPASGLNAALSYGASEVSRRGACGVLVLPGDVPLVTAADIAAMLEGHESGPAVTVARAERDGGSNALACSPPDMIPFRFGENSFQRHCEAAREAGVEPGLRHLPNLALDIDRPDDLGALLTRTTRTMTQDYLSQFGPEAFGPSEANGTAHGA
jgi:2-phospho-L-lactate guanylyltransferase